MKQKLGLAPTCGCEKRKAWLNRIGDKIMKRYGMLIALWILWAGNAWAVDNVWTGAAQPVAQVTTITVADTWASGDTASIICNNKTLTLTCGASMDTVGEVAAGIAEMVNAADNDNLTADMTINFGGREFGEFRDMEATVSGAVVTLTSTTPGVPFTVTVAEDTAGDGTVGSPSTTTAATGPNHFYNEANWSTGTVPADDDKIIFKEGSIPCLYHLNDSSGSPVESGLTLEVEDSYTGQIGLDRINTTHQGYPYVEYRTRFLNLDNTGTSGTQDHKLGSLHSTVPSLWRAYLNLDGTAGSSCALQVYNAGKRDPNTGAKVKLAGGNGVVLSIYAGSLDIGLEEGLGNVAFNGLTVYQRANIQNPADVIIGDRITPTGNLSQYSGKVELRYDWASTMNLYAGTLTILGTGTDVTTATVHSGAQLIHRGGNITNLNVHEGGQFVGSP